MSKQAAGKTVERLESRGYVARVTDPSDARRKLVTTTERGRDLLSVSAAAFDRAYAERARRLGPARMAELRAALPALAGTAGVRLDLAGWLGA